MTAKTVLRRRSEMNLTSAGINTEPQEVATKDNPVLMFNSGGFVAVWWATQGTPCALGERRG